MENSLANNNFHSDFQSTQSGPEVSLSFCFACGKVHVRGAFNGIHYPS